MPMLMTAYTYAKLRAMGSFDALKSAMASVPIKMDILRYETQAKKDIKGQHLSYLPAEKKKKKKTEKIPEVY